MYTDVFGLNRKKFIDRSERPRFKIGKNLSNTPNSAFETLNFGYDCLLMVETNGENPLKSAQELVDIAIISHKHLSSSDFYYRARKRLMEQQLKVVARCLLRLQKKFPVKAKIAVFESSSKSWWVSMVGDMCFYIFNQNKLERLLPKKISYKQLDSIQIKGIQILGLQIVDGELIVGERFMLINHNLNQIVTQEKLADILSKNALEKDLTKISQEIIDCARKKDSKQAYGIYLWEKLP